MNKTKVYMMVGLPGAGKSTYIKEHFPNLPVVSRDNARTILGYTKSNNEKVILDYKDECKVTDYIQMECVTYLLHHQEFVIDNINIQRADRTKFIQFLHNSDAYVTIIQLNTPFETCVERRKEQIPLTRMKRAFELFTPVGENEADEVIYING